MRYRGEIQRHKIWDELEEKYKDTKSEMRYRGEIQKLDEIESRNTKIRWDREEKYKDTKSEIEHRSQIQRHIVRDIETKSVRVVYEDYKEGNTEWIHNIRVKYKMFCISICVKTYLY